MAEDKINPTGWGGAPVDANYYVSSADPDLENETVLTGLGSANGIVKSDGAGNFSDGVAGTDYSTPSSTDTLTNKTYELEDAPASDHTASGTQTTMTVDVNTYGVAGALHLDTDGNWVDADADTTTTMPCAALALETGTGSKKVLLQGFMRDDTWNWTVGGIIYVSTTAGNLTQTAPSGTGDQVQVVGIATHADRIWFNPDFNLIEIV